MKDDATLLEEYARGRSEAAFAELVRRQVNFVYAAALRQVNGDRHLAQDVTQAVFTDLARKARSLAGRPALAGWLFTSTRFAAAKVVRTEQRRRKREEEAQRMHDDHEPDDAAARDWDRVRPVLDAALAELGERDRTAILLRYLQGMDFAGVGARLAISENAARMCADRALDKLRARLARRGVTSTTAALALALANQLAVAAPSGLATTVSGTALAGATTGGIVALMNLAKIQWGIAATVVAAGTGIGLVQEQTRQRLEAELAVTPVADVARWREANGTLAAARDEAVALAVSDAEWARLRDEVVALQDRLKAEDRAAREAEREASERARRTAVPMKELDQAPQAAFRKAPSYPASLRDASVPGSVVVEFVIDDTGRMRDAKVLQSTAKEFELPTLAALAEWRFAPGLKGGRQVNTRVTQRFDFDPTGSPRAEPATWF